MQYQQTFEAQVQEIDRVRNAHPSTTVNNIRSRSAIAQGYGQNQYGQGMNVGGSQYGDSQHGGSQQGGSQYGGTQQAATPHGDTQHGGTQNEPGNDNDDGTAHDEYGYPMNL
jgi:hypothetical protein